ncbi:MAG TPA: nucleotidyltransferase domain-containing protein [Opitutae bacterium]|nr:nucleotidyltransferase domain-containing protein [Opitutae bacterium]
MRNEVVSDAVSAVLRYSFFTKLEALSFVEKMYVYGSRARNEASERADIDLAISAPRATEKDWNKVMEILDAADTLLKIDCVWLESLDAADLLRKNILEDGKAIFTRKNS